MSLENWNGKSTFSKYGVQDIKMARHSFIDPHGKTADLLLDIFRQSGERRRLFCAI